MALAAKSYTVGSASELGVKVDSIAAFYDAHWNRKIALSLPSFYRWQLLDPPASEGTDHCCVAVDRDGAILGVMAANPHRFMLSGKSRHAAEMSTWVVSKEARGRGVGQAIMRWLQSRYDVLLGAGISTMAVPLYMLAGYRYIRHIPRYVQIYRTPPDDFLRLTESGRRMLQQPRPPRGTSSLGAKVTPIGLADLADFAEWVLRPFNHFVRDRANLVWRYGRHPVFTYDSFSVTAPTGRAAVGLRLDKIGGTKIAHIVELFGEEGVLSAAVAFIDDYCREHNVSLADFTGTLGAICSRFLDAGWYSTLDDADVQVVHLFYPVEFRSPPTTSLMLWSRDDMTDLLNYEKLYFTKGDLDLDRPTVSYYEQHKLALA